MTITCLYMSKLVLNFLIKQNHNKTQCLTKFWECQFLKACQTKCLQILFNKEAVFLIFVDTNSQHKYICLRRNKQQHPIP